jgi:hypothetical protein
MRRSSVPLTLLVALTFALAGCVGGAASDDAEDDPPFFEPPPPDPNEGLVARFAVSDAAPRAGLEVSFDASETEFPSPGNDTAESGSDGADAEYEWDFGDGRSASGVNVTHVFESAGQYEVRLVVRTDAGGEGNATQQLVVSPPPEADLDESWSGSFTAGAPVEGDAWIARHEFQVDEAQSEVVIVLNGSGTGAAMSLTLTDADGEELATGTGSDLEKRMTIGFLPAGSYTVRVHLTGGIAASYDLAASGTATFVEEAEADPEA